MTCKPLGIKVGGQPMKYLGAYTTLGRFIDRYQQIMADRATQKIQGWYNMLIPQAGKFALINFVVNAITMH